MEMQLGLRIGKGKTFGRLGVMVCLLVCAGSDCFFTVADRIV